MEKKNEIVAYVENMGTLLLGILLFGLPLVFTTVTTDPFILPKQILLGVISLVVLLLLSARMIADGKVTVRRTPFDLPVLLFAIVTLISSIIAINQIDAITNYVPLLFAIIAFYLITNVIKEKGALLFASSALVAGGVVVSVLAILSYAKMYALPFAIAKTQTFSPLSSPMDQAIYLALLLPIAIAFATPLFRVKSPKEVKGKAMFFGVAAVILVAGLGLTVYELFTIQKPILLPFETGFQTAFASISQDNGRVFQGFLFGSGFGSFVVDFTRFKPATFNLNPNLWSLTFLHSSSGVLEMLATIGFLGVAAFAFIIVKVISAGKYVLSHSKRAEDATTIAKGMFLSLALLLVLSFLLPITFVPQTLLFLLLGLSAAAVGIFAEDEVYDIELTLVALKKVFNPGVLGHPFGSPEASKKEEKTFSKMMPITFFVFVLLFVGGISFLSVRYVAADMLFQSSLVAAQQNNGLKTYTDESNAINMFPWRDSFYRIYSQTNIALANSLAAAQPQGTSPSAQVQQTITTLIQQSISAGRNATTLAPLSTYNWQNLSSVYRALIGFGQDADRFAILTQQQAIALDPNNPQLYVNLGGIYYQLGQWDNAQRQFQIATNLKPDFANAYYNLGHALEQKGDLPNALTAYQTVKSLITADAKGTKQIDGEIATLQKKIGSSAEQTSTTQPTQGSTNSPAGEQEPLGISEPQNKLPDQKNQVKIPEPSVAPASQRGEPVTPTTTTSPTPSQPTQ